MDKKHLGARSEMIAVSWLLKLGYEVFRNVSQHGPIDLIAFKYNNDGFEQLLLDVKSNSYKSDGSPIKSRITEEQRRIDVKIINVYPDDLCIIDYNPVDSVDFTTKICRVCKLKFKFIDEKRVYCSYRCRMKEYNDWK